MEVAKLREAGAIIMGKANLAEFATDGHFSPSASGQVWNAFDPSISPIGSSGGSAVAVASSFAAAALGTQTGDSLWGPSSAARLVSLRGTDGMQSTDGVMPLTYVQDYAGVISRTLPGPRAAAQRDHDRRPGRPARRRLQRPPARRTGPPAWTPTRCRARSSACRRSAFNDPFGTTGTSDAMRAQFAHFVAAGATVKAITDPPNGPASTPGDRGFEGWRQWVLAHPDNPYTDVPQIIRSPLRIPQFRNTNPYTGTGAMTPEQVDGLPGRARDLPPAAGRVDGHPGRRRGRLPGPALATSTSTTRSSRASAAATRRARRRACRT